MCYHSTSTINEEEINLHRKIEEVCEKFDQVLICGDFNHNTIDWELLHAGQEREAFLKLVLDKFLTHVRQPTRAGNILDLVLSSDPVPVNNLEVSAPLRSSDHNVMNFKINTDWENKGWKEYYYDYKKARYKEIRREFSKIKWKEVFQSKNLSEMWRIFVEEYDRIVKLYVQSPKEVEIFVQKLDYGNPNKWNEISL